jgi:menaquinone-dependent protoporphyrinogen oxidase
MKTIIVYLSRHGCAEKASKLLIELLEGEVSVINLKEEKKPDISTFSSVIIGGSIHAGQIQDGIRKFCQGNMDRLLQVKVGLYLCCMETGETAWKQFNNAFPEELRDHATTKGLFGGEFNLEKMSFFERKIVEKVAKVTESKSMMNMDAIREFAEQLK